MYVNKSALKLATYIIVTSVPERRVGKFDVIFRRKFFWKLKLTTQVQRGLKQFECAYH